MKKNQRLNAILIIALTLGIGLTISVVSAAPPITVTSAVPDEAEQGSIDLPVIINGRGFDNNMDVKFCRSEMNETCSDGGVNVKPGSVKFISSKKLEVTVDVDVDAIIGTFDIEAISLSSGRRGRGIEKFSVLVQGGGKSETADCQIHFSVAFRDDADDGIRSDGIAGGVYPDPNALKDKSGGGTGSGPGWRFDTNGSIKLDGAGGTRELETHTIPMGPTSSGADFRFHLNSGGLDLCSLGVDLGNPAAVGHVPMILHFANNVGEEFHLLYGCINHGGEPFTGGGGSPVDVTRTGGDVGAWATGDTWTIEGTQACLITENNYATGTDVLVDNEVDAPFQLTITAQ